LFLSELLYLTERGVDLSLLSCQLQSRRPTTSETRVRPTTNKTGQRPITRETKQVLITRKSRQRPIRSKTKHHQRQNLAEYSAATSKPRRRLKTNKPQCHRRHLSSVHPYRVPAATAALVHLDLVFRSLTRPARSPLRTAPQTPPPHYKDHLCLNCAWLHHQGATRRPMSAHKVGLHLA
jgi:hypothetical protein